MDMRDERLCVVLLSMMAAFGAASADDSKPDEPDGVLTGIDVLQRDDFRPLSGQRIGLITNQTGVNREGVSTVTVLHEAKAVDLRVLFSPEHGFAGKLETAVIGDAVETRTGLPIVSLYGEARTPPPESLRELDAIVFDIQDVGARFYTYISTMGNAMRAAAEHDVAFIVLDRPNPINGMDVAGPVLDEGLQSFVGYHTLPVRHGMSVGELARMFNEEQKIGVELTVIRMERWQRSQYFDATGLTWINPSPNMRSLTQAVLYPGVGLLETTNVSVGRGTDTPFEVVGAPWLDGRRLAQVMNRCGLPGVRFVPIRFTPGVSKFAGEECGGINIIVTRREEFRPVRTGLTLARQLRLLFPDDWDMSSFNRLLADEQTFTSIRDGDSIERIEAAYVPELERFRQRRGRFLLYGP